MFKLIQLRFPVIYTEMVLTGFFALVLLYDKVPCLLAVLGFPILGIAFELSSPFILILPISMGSVRMTSRQSEGTDTVQDKWYWKPAPSWTLT